MRRRPEGSTGSQERQDMEHMSGTSGSSGQVSTGSTTGATSTGMQDTGSATYQQQEYPQQQGYPPQQQGYPPQQDYQQQGAGPQTTTSYGPGTAPARPMDYGGPDYGREQTSRSGGALAILAGALAFLEGLAFAIRSHSYVSGVGYLYRWHLNDWGWVLMILGGLLIAAGVSHLLGIKGSRHVAGVLAVLVAVVAFLTLFYSVIWGIVVLAASAFAAHSMLSHREMEYPAGTGPGGYGTGQNYGSQSYPSGQGGTSEEAMSGGRGSHRR
jgi:hypothetical protein